MRYDLTLTDDEARRVKECARWCAERNLVPNDGDPLGPQVQFCCMAIEWIRVHSVRFRELVARERTKYLAEQAAGGEAFAADQLARRELERQQFLADRAEAHKPVEYVPRATFCIDCKTETRKLDKHRRCEECAPKKA